MTEPLIVPREEHPISRRDVDADALKVLYRLHGAGFIAYLVGGSVRDLLLGRRPKDFDVGTSAHPYQIKKLFRNCWIIGRRFRLAHVRFGPKTIEVATFRKHVVPGTETEPVEAPRAPGPPTRVSEAPHDHLARHDNTFGTPEEDAFRRDFTVNALFYDIGTRAVIDYVGGLKDLRDGLVRSIGDPHERFQEDPVRMFRAVVLAARLGFRLDPPVAHAIARQRHLLATASPARLIEEYYKVLRSGAAEASFRSLAEHGLLEPVTPELQREARNPALWNALAALDAYRKRFEAIPPSLSNPVILGTLLVPLKLMPRWTRPPAVEEPPSAVGPHRRDAHGAPPRRRRPPKEPILKIGALPIARRDTERLRQLLSLQGRLMEVEMSPRARRALVERGPFEDALTWLEIHGHQPAIFEHWKGFLEALGPRGHASQVLADVASAKATAGKLEGAGAPGHEPGRRRRRRRRRRRHWDG
jgi:poly(A) polymerase